MPAITKSEAVERLAKVVETAPADELLEVYRELFPEQALPAHGLHAHELAEHVRKNLEPEEVVSLWHVVFPADRQVDYDEEDERLHYSNNRPSYSEP